MKIVVLGSGSWGTAISLTLAHNGHDVILAGRDPDNMDLLKKSRENLRYLPGFILPENIEISSFDELNQNAEFWVVAVPCTSIQSVLSYIPNNNSIVVIASKGLNETDDFLVSKAISHTIPTAKIGVLSGPNLAKEIVQGIPSAAVVASEDPEICKLIGNTFRRSSFRIYMSNDVVGVELAGALKNPLAIGAGISDGLGFGNNTKATLLARGLHEITKIGLNFGAKIETFMGIAGVGDLFATANSTLSRNYRVGLAIGKGRTLQSIMHEIGQVAEGVPTSNIAVKMALKHQIELPLIQVIDAILKGKISPKDGVGHLMEREPKYEGFECQKVV